MSIAKYLILFYLGVLCALDGRADSNDWIGFGPLYQRFQLTRSTGSRTEALGPLFYSEKSDTQRQWAIPPLGMSMTEDPAVESKEFDLAYPLLTYDRFGG